MKLCANVWATGDSQKWGVLICAHEVLIHHATTHACVEAQEAPVRVLPCTLHLHLAFQPCNQGGSCEDKVFKGTPLYALRPAPQQWCSMETNTAGGGTHPHQRGAGHKAQWTPLCRLDGGNTRQGRFSGGPVYTSIDS